ncbi:class I SAM-dependent methyltransferase [Frankia sp. CNm7]|uniref:Class I SAM-dependent methyltransferase n=1 Tax=Frankia nepalensis TaxID=1836974 RepID=A0A937UQH0_9ACTN|nr:class I SAM-dependent methyltransferase [Frankia nepalensis]MBL7497217.1 class I SAM-dependent methyltransferase [Frankia nepalensis]MBL7510348.1 class I SAM-dependent methyltransferase [Frankia nepalensis]MBL7519754.1 class I SAM-dependent methyltransferase [Frankia nepalensis]MBL7626686.1 class I SAM-dependent methyltransferase [Frankia nepalensis]
MNRWHWLSAAVCAGVGLNTARLRRRLAAVAVIEPSDAPVHHSHVFLFADGVRLDEAQQRAASAHARRHGLDVLDIVPAELTADRLLDLARLVDATTYQQARLAPGRGAYQALLIDRDVLTRAGLRLKDVTEVDLVTVTATLKRYAPVTTGLAVLPGLRAAPRTGARRLAVRHEAYRWDPAAPLGPLLRDLALARGLAAAPGWTLAAGAVSWLQPAVVAAGGPIRLRPAEALASPLTRRRAAAEFVADLAGRGRRPSDGPALDLAAADGGPAQPARWRFSLPRAFPTEDEARAAELRAAYTAELTDGVERFLEKPRVTCPWCGGGRLRKVIDGFDATQAKPGRFRYGRCADCRHVFLNPRLTPDGLDFYYRDFYDGLGAPIMEVIAEASRDRYLSRARSVPATSATPTRWLDVGAGMGHFCLMARSVWPDTAFHGLDLGDALEEGTRRGWLDHAYRGQFPELAGSFAGRYDVVSMFHYLEHTLDPRAELAAAATALRPGGRLLIEVPNPDSLSARVYGPLWSGWLAPQHLNLVPADNLVTALTEHGFTVENVDFGETHLDGDGMFAWWALCQRLAPSAGLPWRSGTHPGTGRARRAATLAALAPLYPAFVAADAAARPYLTSGRRANAYRVLAQLS